MRSCTQALSSEVSQLQTNASLDRGEPQSCRSRALAADHLIRWAPVLVTHHGHRVSCDGSQTFRNLSEGSLYQPVTSVPMFYSTFDICGFIICDTKLQLLKRSISKCPGPRIQDAVPTRDARPRALIMARRDGESVGFVTAESVTFDRLSNRICMYVHVGSILIWSDGSAAHLKATGFAGLLPQAGCYIYVALFHKSATSFHTRQSRTDASVLAVTNL